MNIFQILQKISLVPSYLWDKMWAPVWKRCMKHCGEGVYLRPMLSDIKGLWNLSVGDGTSIPKGSTIYCTDAPCTIGKKVLFGPNPTIITGDHRIDVIGKYIMDYTEKLPENDAPVVIEDDVWTGANVTILKGNDWARLCYCRRCCSYQIFSSLQHHWWGTCKSAKDEVY